MTRSRPYPSNPPPDSCCACRLPPARRTTLRRLAALTAGALLPPAAAGATPAVIAQPHSPGPAAFAARAAVLREIAIARGDQPYGAVVVSGARIVGEGVSAVLTNADPTAHAERMAIRDAQRRLGSTDLSGCDLYGTSPACAMCEAAAREARIARMYHGSAPTDVGAPGVGWPR